MKWEVTVGPEGIEKTLDDELMKVVGVGHFEYRRAMANSGNMPMAMFNEIVRQVDRSGVVEKLERWDREARKSKAGRKALISFRAVLIVELITAMWNKGVQYQEIANTLTHRLTRRQFDALGIKWERVPENTWLHRHWRAKKRLLHLIDPYHHAPLNKRMTLADSAKALAAKDSEREDRLRWVLQALVDASVAPLPQRYRDAFTATYPSTRRASRCSVASTARPSRSCGRVSLSMTRRSSKRVAPSLGAVDSRTRTSRLAPTGGLGRATSLRTSSTSSR